MRIQEVDIINEEKIYEYVNSNLFANITHIADKKLQAYANKLAKWLESNLPLTVGNGVNPTHQAQASFGNAIINAIEGKDVETSLDYLEDMVRRYGPKEDVKNFLREVVKLLGRLEPDNDDMVTESQQLNEWGLLLRPVLGFVAKQGAQMATKLIASKGASALASEVPKLLAKSALKDLPKTQILSLLKSANITGKITKNNQDEVLSKVGSVLASKMVDSPIGKKISNMSNDDKIALIKKNATSVDDNILEKIIDAINKGDYTGDDNKTASFMMLLKSFS